jgi:ABC-type sugar transport system, periplasmic component
MKKIIALFLSLIIVIGFTIQASAFSKVAIKGISLDKTKITLKIGETYNLKITLNPKNTTQKLLIYTAGNKKIAIVDTKGKVTAIGAGKTVITVISSSNKKIFTKCDVTITSPTPAPKKEYKLSLGLPGGYAVTNQQIVDDFKEKFPNIKLKIDESPWGEFVTKVAAQIATGTCPDVWFQENAVILGYGKKGAAVDLSGLISKDLNKSEYTDALFAARDSSGKVWGIPHGLQPIALAYNKKMFTEAKIPFPTDAWTYNDLIETAKKLTKDTNNDGTPDVYGFLSGYGITQGWFPWIKSTGGVLLDKTFTKAMFTDPKTIEGLTLWADFSNKLKASAPRTFTTANGNEVQAFGNEKGAMYFIQYNAIPTLAKNFPSLDYDVVKIPIGLNGKRVVPYVANAWFIFSRASADGKEAAWTWIKYYLSAEAQNNIAYSGSAVPVRISSNQRLNNVSQKPVNRKAFTQGVSESGATMDESPTWNIWRAEAQPFFYDIYDGKITPQEGAAKIQEKVQKILDDNQ